MNWRSTLISAVLAGALGLTVVPRANADPPPWAGKYKHHEEHWDAGKHWRHDRDDWRHDRDAWRRGHDWDRDDWRRRYGHYDRDWRWDHRGWDRDYRYGRYDDYRYGRYDRPYYGGRYTAACESAQNRLDADRANIDRIGPTGRHRKALQWYEEDIAKARRDLARCG